MALSNMPEEGSGPGLNPGGDLIECLDVGVTFGSYVALSDISLSIEAGEFTCLLGPSGCGKSTLLNLIAGFITPSAGTVKVGGQVVTKPDLRRGVVFQSTEALFPWLTVAENIAFGPRMRGIGPQRRAGPVESYLRLVGLAHAGHLFPREISGGMRQRVQLARVLVNEPPVVLMDEPFGSLDAQTREILQAEVVRLWQATRPTVVFVTHDVLEAVTLADRVITMTHGPSARVKGMYTIREPRPRDLQHSTILSLYSQIREDIGEEVRLAARLEGAGASG